MGRLIIDPHSDPDNAHLPLANHSATILATTLTFLGIAIFAVSFRICVRLRDRLWGWDDAFVTLACMSSVAGDTLVCIMPADGLGLHFWTLDVPHLLAYFKHTYMTNVAYCTSATLIKLSILLQFLRLFAECAYSTSTFQYRLARRMTWTLLVMCAIWGTIFICLAIFPCRPFAKNWNSSLPGHCVGWGTKDPNVFFAMFFGHSVSNSLLDIMVLLLPVPFFNMLRLAEKSRAGLITLYSLGVVVAAISVGRIIALSVNRLGTVPVLDITFHTPIIYILGVLEVNIAIIAASIPVFWPVIATFTSHKILVVNEIEIHVESASRDSIGSGGATEIGDWKNTSNRRESRMTITSKSFDRTRSKSSHRRRASDVSILGKGLGHRPSQESTFGLSRITTNERESSKSSLHNEDGEWTNELDRIHSSRTITTVERSHIPLEQMKAFN